VYDRFRSDDDPAAANRPLARNTGAVDVRAVLADVAGIGPYFTVVTDPTESVDPTWRPLRELIADGEPLRERIAHVRRSLFGADGAAGPADRVADRVAASITFQGLAALLVSAPYAAAVLHGGVPRLTPDVLLWRPSAGGPPRLFCPAPEVVPGDVEAVLRRIVLDELLDPLAAAVMGQVRVAERVLWGNAASALAAAKRLVGAARPAASGRAAAVAERLLATGRLAGSGELLPPRGPDRDWTFRRRSCCLYHRVPGGGLCDDCVLRPRSR
jgi:hypothetical protein